VGVILEKKKRMYTGCTVRGTGSGPKSSGGGEKNRWGSQDTTKKIKKGGGPPTVCGGNVPRVGVVRCSGGTTQQGVCLVCHENVCKGTFRHKRVLVPNKKKVALKKTGPTQRGHQGKPHQMWGNKC